MVGKILLIDDNHHVLLSVSRVLVSWGHTVDAVENPVEAKALLQEYKYSLIICDSHFEAYESGEEFIIGNSDLIGDAKVVLFTGKFSGEIGEREQLLQSLGVTIVYKTVSIEQGLKPILDSLE